MWTVLQHADTRKMRVVSTKRHTVLVEAVQSRREEAARAIIGAQMVGATDARPSHDPCGAEG